MDIKEHRSRSSSDSLSCLQTVHDHILPEGWYCKYDPTYFIYETVADSDLVPAQEKQFKSMKKSNLDRLHRSISPDVTNIYQIVDRISNRFPSVEKSYIKHLMRIHDNRENLVISALLAESYAKDNVFLDNTLFYKLKESFPHIEQDIIRRLLIQNDNKEHQVISALLSLFGLFNTTRYEHSKKPQLKLKYLKFAFPDVDEIVLLDLLFKNEFDACKVIKHLKAKGHQWQDIIELKLSKIPESAILKEAADRLRSSRPKTIVIQEKFHPNLWEQEDIRKTITEMFPDIDIFLVNWALESTKFDIKLAKSFLETMTPQRSEEYLVRSFPQEIRAKLKRLLVSRQTQTDSVTQDLFGKFIEISDSIESNKNEDTQQKNDYWKDDEEKSTNEKLEDSTMIRRNLDLKTKKLSLGPNKANRLGPNRNFRINQLLLKYGSDKTRLGPDSANRQGKAMARNEMKSISHQGPQESNKQGAIGKKIIKIKDFIDLFDRNNFILDDEMIGKFDFGYYNYE
ncbi:DNA-directed RNA polymerase II subunit RPB1 [Sarcoptes scabiei]|nr:DNA-directed RNA polymerase II subunit RPB1 [Sarcoptes scabiei]